ncbi:hypothetical protein BV20DRAFT_349323 [Pilatotrama ljubarskyi]|nr:hypothetical protein BV20DRAFT_349323 [Pilatotrama ljubarskyi]
MCEDYPQYEFEVDAFSSLPNIPRERVIDFSIDGWPDQYTMDEFWFKCEDWLAARGYMLHGRRPPGSRSLEELWYSPPYTAPATLPYATRVLAEKQPRYPLVPRASDFATDRHELTLTQCM